MERETYLSQQSISRLKEIETAFSSVEQHQESAAKLDSIFEAFGEDENRIFVTAYEQMMGLFIDEQTQAVQNLARVALSTDKDTIEQEMRESSSVQSALAAPEQTQAKLDKVTHKRNKLLDILGVVSEEERAHVETATILAETRFANQLSEEREHASKVLEDIEGVQTVLQRPLPEFTIAGETADVIKPILRELKSTPSAKAEVQKARRGEVRAKFIDLMKERPGDILKANEIAEMLHPKTYSIDPDTATKRVYTMLGDIFNGKLDSYVSGLGKHGLGIQRFAHRTYVDDGGEIEVSKVSYEYRIYGGQIEPIRKDSYTELTDKGIVEHVWEDPVKRKKQ